MKEHQVINFVSPLKVIDILFSSKCSMNEQNQSRENEQVKLLFDLDCTI